MRCFSQLLHTIDTGCNAAASNPKWWDEEKWFIIIRMRHIRRNVDPIITWKTWNPVATKVVDPESCERESERERNTEWEAVRDIGKIMR